MKQKLILITLLTKLFVFPTMAQLKYNSIENEQDVQLNAEDILNMDLDDLMNLEVKVGNISGTTSKRLPVSVTTITKEQIELSNVQNLLHLIQIYVPGASYWRHSEGPMIGMRGITSDRNNKLLMTLNGIVINQKAHNGVIHELEDWNMEDIEKVEIIRGPGSVTYGPGAIAGVINIVTKKAGELDGLKASAQYVTKYNNKTASLSYGFKKEKVKGYFHAGIAKTEGFIPDGMLMTNDSISVRGINQPGSVFEAPAQTYMGDFNDEPQIKLLADINFLDDFNFTARYNKSGASVGSYSTPQSKPIIGFDEKNRKILQNYEDRSFQSQQQLLLSLKNASHIESSNVDIETEFAYTSADYLRTRPASEIYDRDQYPYTNIFHETNSFDNPLNLLQNFAENSFIAKTTALYKINDQYKVALGIESINTHIGKGWGDDARDFRMGDGQNIVNGKNSTSFITTPSNINISKALNPDSIEGKKYFIVGNGWSTHDLGFVMEANLEFNPYFSLLLSARADKNTYSDWLFSPRAAIISELNDNHVVKLVLQQSNKINTAEQLYIANRTNSTGDVESVTTTELIYTGLVSDHSLINFSTYLNQQSAIGWNPGTKSTTPIADLSIAGFEFDYQLKAFSVFAGFSHAYTKLLNYSLKENVPHTFLSYSEFSLPKTTEEIGSGKGLIGISENTTKLYIDKFLMNRKFALHTELATFWSFNGSKGVQNVVVNAQKTDEDAAKQKALYDEAFNEHNFFGTSLFWNATFSAHFMEKLTVQVGIHNILGGEHARIDDQVNAFNLDQLTWSKYVNSANYLVEPRTYSLKLTYKL